MIVLDLSRSRWPLLPSLRILLFSFYDVGGFGSEESAQNYFQAEVTVDVVSMFCSLVLFHVFSSARFSIFFV